MQNKKNIYIYYFLSMVMMFFPIISMFTFIPFVMVNRKYGYKNYLSISFTVSLAAFIFIGSFTSLISFFISFIIINGIEKNKKGYKILFLGACICSFLMILDFIIIRLNSNSYIKILEIVNNAFSGISLSNSMTDPKKTLENLSNFYPTITFFISYVLCSFGYCYLYKRVYFLENKKENIVMPIDYKIIIFIIAFCYVFNLLFKNINQNLYYSFYLLYVNIFSILFIMLLVQGFIVFNIYLKKRLQNLKSPNIIANLFSLISLFLIFSYFIYLIYGSYNSIVEGVKNEKNID